MFRVNSETNKEKSTKKKLLFISTIISNNKIEHNTFDNSNPKNSCSNSISTAPSLKISQNSSKSKSESKNVNKTYKPKQKIFFKLFHVNLPNQEKENEKKNQKPKKEIIIKKRLKFNYKQRQMLNKKGMNKNYVAGRWLIDEHQRFIDGVIKYGNNWRQVQKYVGTRSGTQTRSHAQKFFEKLKRSKIFKTEKYDFSRNSLKLLHDIMANLSEKEYEQTLKKLHSLTYRMDLKSDNEESELNENVEKNENVILLDNMNNSYCKENDVNHEEVREKIRSNNNGFSYIETINDKLYNYNDYLSYNYNYTYYNINQQRLNFGIRSRKGSEIFNNKRKDSICEIEKDEEIIDYSEEYNNVKANVENNEDRTLNNQSNDFDNSFNQETSRKMSLEEKLIATVY
jgi:SHAQKYF class myb-like DNA-binding protein